MTASKVVRMGRGEWRVFEQSGEVARVYLSRGEYRPQVTVNGVQLFRRFGFSSLDSAVAWVNTKRRAQNENSH